MDQSEEFLMEEQENKVCKLVKSLNCLKRAPKQWHEKFDEVILSIGFKINDSDKCIYSKCDNNICVIICLYVDDMHIFRSNLDYVLETKQLLSSKFSMKDMGETYTKNKIDEKKMK